MYVYVRVHAFLCICVHIYAHLHIHIWHIYMYMYILWSAKHIARVMDYDYGYGFNSTILYFMSEILSNKFEKNYFYVIESTVLNATAKKLYVFYLSLELPIYLQLWKLH